MHKINILFSKRHNFIENIISFFHGGKYTHVAISLIGTNGPFYSFNLRGFQPERLSTSKSFIYTICISDEQFKHIELRIREMHRDQHKWHYSLLGVFLAIMRIPHHIKNHMFCSQFVMQLLQDAGVISSKQLPSTTLPNDLYDMLVLNN